MRKTLTPILIAISICCAARQAYPLSTTDRIYRTPNLNGQRSFLIFQTKMMKDSVITAPQIFYRNDTVLDKTNYVLGKETIIQAREESGKPVFVFEQTHYFPHQTTLGFTYPKTLRRNFVVYDQTDHSFKPFVQETVENEINWLSIALAIIMVYYGFLSFIFLANTVSNPSKSLYEDGIKSTFTITYWLAGAVVFCTNPGSFLWDDSTALFLTNVCTSIIAMYSLSKIAAPLVQKMIAVTITPLFTIGVLLPLVLVPAGLATLITVLQSDWKHGVQIGLGIPAACWVISIVIGIIFFIFIRRTAFNGEQESEKVPA